MPWWHAPTPVTQLLPSSLHSTSIFNASSSILSLSWLAVLHYSCSSGGVCTLHSVHLQLSPGLYQWIKFAVQLFFLLPISYFIDILQTEKFTILPIWCLSTIWLHRNNALHNIFINDCKMTARTGKLIMKVKWFYWFSAAHKDLSFLCSNVQFVVKSKDKAFWHYWQNAGNVKNRKYIFIKKERLLRCIRNAVDWLWRGLSERWRSGNW